MTSRASRWCVALLAAFWAPAWVAAQPQPSAAPQTPAKTSASPTSTAAPADPGWPRTVTKDGHSLTYYQPQIDEWENQLKLSGRLALSLTPQGAKEPIFGVARVEADTQTDTENRTVYLYNIRLTTVHFPVSDTARAEKIAAAARELFSPPAIVISLDRLLAGMQLGQSGVRETKISLEPPKIFYSTKPAVLVMVDGKPVLLDIENSGVQEVLNTNWDLLFDKSTSHYYLLNKQSWLASPSLDGPWKSATNLPASFQKLPQTEAWAEVRKNVPPKGKAGAAPTVFLSYEPAELILVNGNPKMSRIGGTQLSHVSNTESDLFFHQGDRYYYLLTSGRWFRADSLEGPWKSAAQDLPDDFARIPPDHERANVLASVRGTRQAEEAILVASIPQTATLNRATATAQAEFVGGTPEWESIPETSVSYAKNTQQDVFKIGDLYYLCFQGAWFVAKSADGPWEVSSSVPQEIAGIPPESPKHNVTYVNVYESTPTTVTCGYTAGYTGMFIAMGTLMWGTGYYYPPYWGWGYHPYPVYWPPAYHTWGTAAYYNPYTGSYGRRTAVYGPYGGYGYSAVYNPRTGAYARGASAWGPGGYAWRAGGYNPRTGSGVIAGGYYDAWSGNYGAGYRGGNQYSRWGEGVVGEGDDWVHAKYRVERGQGGALGIETSEGGKFLGVGTGDSRGFVGKDEDNNVYAGKDGTVYKRDDDGDWHQNVNGDWEEIPKDQVESARQQAQQRGDEARQQRSQSGQASPTQTQAAQTQAAQTQAGQTQRGQTQRTQTQPAPAPSASTAQNRAGTASAGGRAQPGTLPTTNQASAQPSASSVSRSAARPSTTSRTSELGSLESEARARSDGATRSRQYDSWQRSGGSYAGRSSSRGRRR